MVVKFDIDVQPANMALMSKTLLVFHLVTSKLLSELQLPNRLLMLVTRLVLIWSMLTVCNFEQPLNISLMSVRLYVCSPFR